MITILSRLRPRLRIVVNVAFDAALVCTVLYAIASAVTHPTTVPIKPRTNPAQNYLQALLFATPARADVYNFQDKHEEDFAFFDEALFSVTDHEPGFFVDTEAVQPIRREMAFRDIRSTFRLPSDALTFGFQDVLSLSNDRNILVRDGSGISLFATDDARLYGIRTVPEDSVVGFDQGQSRMYAGRREGSAVVLTEYFTGCKRDVHIRLSDRVQDVSGALRALSLPIQRVLKLSPSQNRLAFLDHTSFPRILTVDTLTQEVEQLRVPFLGEDQWHFSPLFLDDHTIAFSAIDRSRWLTASYDFLTKQYAILSPNFSDQIFVSNTEKPVLVQSVFAEAGQNIPFGSRAFYRARGTISRESVDDLGLDSVQRQRLFEESDSTVRFRPSLSESDFSVVNDAQRRAQIRALWAESMTSEPAQTLTLVLRQDEGVFKVLSRTSLTVTEGTSFSLYLRDVSSLLQGLQVPVNAQRQYAARRKELERKGEEYVLLGSFR